MSCAAKNSGQLSLRFVHGHVLFLARGISKTMWLLFESCITPLLPCLKFLITRCKIDHLQLHFEKLTRTQGKLMPAILSFSQMRPFWYILDLLPHILLQFIRALCVWSGLVVVSPAVVED